MRTSIIIKPETRKELAKRGHKGQTYDTIINELIDEVCKKTGQSRENFRL